MGMVHASRLAEELGRISTR
ncbi:MAG: hypothetical protein U0903_17095 [Planctomycetales bacterium]